MNARKQPPSKLKDLRNAAIKVWKARELESMTDDEKDAASEDAQRTKAIEAFNKGVKYSADCIGEDGHAEIAALVKQIMVHLNC